MHGAADNSTAGRLEVGADWITYTTPRGKADGRAETLQAHALASAVAEGHEMRERLLYGYLVRQAGPIVVGHRPDGYLTQVSGPVAARLLPEIARLPGRPTRLDLAATFHLERPRPHYIEDQYEGWLCTPQRFGQARSAQLIKSSDGGLTFYLGAPSSDVRLRIYDHGVKHGYGMPGHSLRWEWQLRSDAAERTLPTCKKQGFREAALAGLIYSMLSDRSLEPIWSASTLTIEPRHKVKTTNQTRIEWLGRSVRPTVDRLRRAGLLNELLAALGLDDLSSGT